MAAIVTSTSAAAFRAEHMCTSVGRECRRRSPRSARGLMSRRAIRACSALRHRRPRRFGLEARRRAVAMAPRSVAFRRRCVGALRRRKPLPHRLRRRASRGRSILLHFRARRCRRRGSPGVYLRPRRRQRFAVQHRNRRAQPVVSLLTEPSAEAPGSYCFGSSARPARAGAAGAVIPPPAPTVGAIGDPCLSARLYHSQPRRCALPASGTTSAVGSRTTSDSGGRTGDRGDIDPQRPPASRGAYERSWAYLHHAPVCLVWR